jgi:biotin carboxyl carrier protein
VQYDVEVNGRLLHVGVRRVDGRFLVSVDGREWTVDAARIDAHMLSLLLGASSREVTVAADPVSRQLVVGLGAVPLSVAVNGRRRGGRKDEGGSGHGPQRMVAPMPGKIVRVLVKAGDPVRSRQPLVVIEAMKMENELRASTGGVVADVAVREGQSVDAGTLLLVVAPA